MSAHSPWSCAFCKAAITWDELFTFNKAGAVHFSCFKKDALARGETEALLDILEAELKILVAYKVAGKTADESWKPLLETQGKDAEKHAAVLTKKLSGAPNI